MIKAIARNCGFKPHHLLRAIPDWLRYRRERRTFLAMPGADAMAWGEELPMLGEWRQASGDPGAYFFQDRLVAGWILENAPARHIDVGSRIDGFVGHLSVFRNVDVLDIRPLPFPIPNVNFHQLDLTRPLDGSWLESTDSLSCLHTIEHFGLGRYGDALDPRGHLMGLAQLTRLVAPGGRFYLSTPIGRERVNFNAHRVFSPNTVLSWFGNEWQIERSAVIDDRNHVTQSIGREAFSNTPCETGVGVLCAKKTAP